MSKTELLQALRETMATEAASAVGAHNITGTFTWSGLPEADRRKIIDALEELAAGSQRRADHLERMIARLEGSDRDVF